MKYFIAAFSIIIIAIFIFLEIPLYLGFFLSAILNMMYYKFREGYTIKELISYYLKGALEHRVIYGIILLIGGIVTVWIASGIVPSLIYYGFELISVNYIFTISFVFTSIVSIFMGTALGTISTVGIALMGIGKGYGVDLHVLLGAIVSGAFIADKISPISGLHNLLLVVTETNYKSVFKEMMKTFIPVYLLSLIFFAYQDFQMFVSVSSLETVSLYKEMIDSYFSISKLLLVVPVIVILLPFFKVKAKFALLIGTIIGAIITIVLQGKSFMKTINILLFGFSIEESSSALTEILTSSGIFGMVEVILIVMGALGLVGIFNNTGIITKISSKLVDNIQSKSDLIIKTGLISSIFTIMTCDQTVGIIVPAKIFPKKYKAFNMSKNKLARILSDTGIVIAPLMPWNVNVIIFSKVLGLTDLGYVKYSVLCFLFPIMTLIFALKKNSN
jgi:NhaC family Na+:H+ antiporter